MAEFIRAFVQRAEGDEAPDAPVRWVASTEGIKRDGLDLKAEDWDLGNYGRYPVVLWGHDYTGHTLPIGTGKAAVEGRQLMIDVTYDREDEFAMRVRSKALKGMVAGSVGWDDVRDGQGKVRHELLEFSMVPVPADPEALPVRQLRALVSEYMTSLDDEGGEPSEDASWQDTAGAMLRVFVPDAWTSEKERRAAYNRLSRAYRLAGKHAPEWLPLAQVDAMGADQRAGLFLEGEPALLPGLFSAGEQGARVGAVLNARNRGDLEEAMSLIQGVLDRAKKEEAAPAEGQPDEGRSAADDALAHLFFTTTTANL